MKKVIRLRRHNKSYDLYFGNNDIDQNNIFKDCELELDQNSPLFLLWLTLHDYRGIIPITLFDLNPGELNVLGGFMQSRKLDDKNILLEKIDDKNLFVRISLQDLREIWLQYIELGSKNADEIILERDGDHFSIRGVWFDKEQNAKTDQ